MAKALIACIVVTLLMPLVACSKSDPPTFVEETNAPIEQEMLGSAEEDTVALETEEATAQTEEITSHPDEEETTEVSAVTDEIISQLIYIDKRPDFAFRYDLTNAAAGEASPIENGYYLSAYKVTNAQYAAFVAETSHKVPSYWKNGSYPEGKADHPVLNISYSDAVRYCEWLSEKYEAWHFRLPTEAEWENAAMGAYYGDASVKYPNGAEVPSYQATTGELTSPFNFNGVIASKLLRVYGSDYIVHYIKGEFAGSSEPLGQCISISSGGGVSNWANHGVGATKGYFLQTDLYALVSAEGGYTTPVGTYAPNSLGLYDMAGNCWDLTSSVVIANNGLEKGVLCYAVRGGSWYATARSCTFYYRGEGRKDSASSTVGFRVAAERVGD
ncbi:MAG: SUMF1/EgtB/PvdO family nonheme iron enzyme [Clostridia bacterium]|nr:SUMF1/EgtB/PvdO family nonheme iron enzyme [Clostridia bacterium]MBR5615828.1 SUMF1/EgtB/PvdO family nonheme iron enzyme [Clostridia bacterium]